MACFSSAGTPASQMGPRLVSQAKPGLWWVNKTPRSASGAVVGQFGASRGLLGRLHGQNGQNFGNYRLQVPTTSLGLRRGREAKGGCTEQRRGGSFKPRGGKQEASERQAERSVALWTKQSGAQVPPRRALHSAPTPPASPCYPAGTSQQNKHTSTPHPEPLSEHMIRAVWRRGIKGTRP